MMNEEAHRKVFNFGGDETYVNEQDDFHGTACRIEPNGWIWYVGFTMKMKHHTYGKTKEIRTAEYLDMNDLEYINDYGSTHKFTYKEYWRS